ncbi:MAG TPA: hypothetical protein VFY21_08535 [Xanthobacteraceae bacterium]|nr:hypothetical protein [Xanthobacteraceae bacterium]
MSGDGENLRPLESTWKKKFLALEIAEKFLASGETASMARLHERQAFTAHASSRRRPGSPLTSRCASRSISVTAPFWLNLQNRFDVRTAERAIARDLANIEPHDAAA